MLQAIIEFIGAPQAGKTTLAELLTHELAAAPLLLVDAAPSQRLTQTMAFDFPKQTLAQLASSWPKTPNPSREAVDWAFHDLTVSVGEEMDLLSMGRLEEPVSESSRQMLAYGLPRLLRNYDYVIVDGYQPLIHQLLPEEALISVVVVGANQTNIALNDTLAESHPLRTPAVIVNRVEGGELPGSIAEAIETHQIRLIGKLPAYPNAEARIKHLADDFHNCMLRLNIPLSPRLG